MTTWSNTNKNSASWSNGSKNSVSWSNTSKTSGSAVTWATVLTTWATEVRTWAGMTTVVSWTNLNKS